VLYRRRPQEIVIMNLALETKTERVRDILRSLEGAVVAFSGGVDSTLLLCLAQEVLGDRCVAVTAISPSLSAKERQEAVDLARRIGAKHREIESRELDRPGYSANSSARCYFCKSELFDLCGRIAGELEFPFVIYGATHDDLADHRPGMRAARQRGVRAPLLEAGLGKEEIRSLSRSFGLPTWNKPALACLASRIPTGTPVTLERLLRVERAEEALRREGFLEVRVRFHEDVARIELGGEEWGRLADATLRERVDRGIREAGFRFVALDLLPYRSGRLHEVQDR
jgi:uncharacterized protein